MKNLDESLFAMGAVRTHYEPNELFTKEIMSCIGSGNKPNIIRRLKELLTMKTSIKSAPGMALLVFALGVGTVGAGAVTNWFHGNPLVKDDASIMTVDVSSCKDAIYSRIIPNNTPQRILGFEQTDFKNLKFKITGEPHISAEDLQKQLLIDCEYAAVTTYFAEKYVGDMVVSGATITDMQESIATVDYLHKGKNYTKSIDLSSVQIVKQGRNAPLTELKKGDYVMISFAHPTSTLYQSEEDVASTDYFAQSSPNGTRALFITQHDMRQASGTESHTGIDYKKMNIMPVDKLIRSHR
ncbi:MAG: hypothetical protein WAQ24_04955 [Candidatus Saccharimonadales bacterium]